MVKRIKYVKCTKKDKETIRASRKSLYPFPYPISFILAGNPTFLLFVLPLIQTTLT